MNNKKWLIFISTAVVFAGLTSFLIREKYLANDQYRFYVEREDRYIKAMEDDIYGGKTSEETISMFITALKSDDAELASKYFILNPDLSRDRWFRTFTIFKDQGLLDKIAGDIEKNPKSIELRLNEYSGVWKIINLK